MNASFEEKSVWITLISLVVVFGLYFILAWGMLAEGVTALPAFLPLFTVVVVALVAIVAAGHVVVAIASRPEGRDERDRLISWRAESRSSWVLGVGVMAAIFALAAPVERVWVAHGLLMALFVSEALKHGLQLLYYRTGA
jgi:hypothetical protein